MREPVLPEPVAQGQSLNSALDRKVTQRELLLDCVLNVSLKKDIREGRSFSLQLFIHQSNKCDRPATDQVLCQEL